ncbi:leucyl aminopeptidase [Salinactinospora qingdaonensis]|uniref:Probable cytosol aminopeptidase n=1 Tax=Salinactinospora qingdaonensis TaxID=702744 RepID=A0ABP7FJL9_9ACTN
MPFATEIRPAPGLLIDSTADLVALPIRSGTAGPVIVTEGVGRSATALDERLPAPLEALAAQYDLKGKSGETVEFPVDLGRGLVRMALFGVGEATPRELRRAGAALARLAKGRDLLATTVAALDDVADEALSAFVEGALLASYTFSLATGANRPKPVPTAELFGADPERIAEPLRRGHALAQATALARDLINTPSGEKGPAWLAEQAQRVAAETDLDSAVWDESDLARDGFRSILAVGQGAARPPRLVQLSYEPPGATRHVVLVGKGITFDTGGLSLKPNDNMMVMKTDMSGAAIVLGAMSVLARLGVTARVTGLLPIAENAFSGEAQRPGDVITTYSGHTVEVLNTDAEGRLVMADAMGYATGSLAPDTLVDVATLTGAAKLALGTGIGALFATTDDLASALTDAGERSGETVWRLPLVEDYRDALDSPVADLANVATKSDHGNPGAINAALFLREFTAGIPWAHLDIAGPGRSTTEDAEITKGGTAFGTRLLLRWLTEQ